MQLTTIGLRTTKPMVRDELGIPEQTRYLVPIELGRVEKHVSAFPSFFSDVFLMPGYSSSTTKTWNKLSSPWVSTPAV